MSVNEEEITLRLLLPFTDYDIYSHNTICKHPEIPTSTIEQLICCPVILCTRLYSNVKLGMSIRRSD